MSLLNQFPTFHHRKIVGGEAVQASRLASVEKQNIKHSLVSELSAFRDNLTLKSSEKRRHSGHHEHIGKWGFYRAWSINVKKNCRAVFNIFELVNIQPDAVARGKSMR